jgi:hypothetical protein
MSLGTFLWISHLNLLNCGAKINILLISYINILKIFEMTSMNKKIVGILICMLMLSTIPVVAGIHGDTETTTGSDGLLGRTVVRGVILGSHSTDRTTSFFALRVHYTTYSLFGQPESGFLILKRVTFTGQFIGYLGKFYIAGTFRGSV